MPRPLLLAALSLLAALPLACSGDAGSAPGEVHAPFVALDVEAARAQAKAQDRVVLLDFTAGWCPPCKEMEKATWPDADVQGWVEREAVAIQVDVDQEGELAGAMGIASIPTLVWLDGEGEELGRHVGFLDPAGFLREAGKYVD